MLQNTGPPFTDRIPFHILARFSDLFSRRNRQNNQKQNRIEEYRDFDLCKKLAYTFYAAERLEEDFF